MRDVVFSFNPTAILPVTITNDVIRSWRYWFAGWLEQAVKQFSFRYWELELAVARIGSNALEAASAH
jgi:hypothetical protein